MTIDGGALVIRSPNNKLTNALLLVLQNQVDFM